MNSRKAFFVSGLLPVLLITSCLQRGQQQLEKELEKHVRFLAGESCTGRKPGTDGYLLAANYADSIFNELGLKFFPGQNTSGYRQEFTLERFIPGEQTQLLLNSATGQARYNVNDDFILFHYGKVGGLVPEGEVVQVGEGLSEPLYGLDDLAGKDIRGRWVLMEEHITSGRLSPLPDELQSLYMDIHTSSLLRADLAADRGAVAVVLQSSGYDPVHWGIRAAAFSDYYAISGEGSPFRSARIPVLFAGPDLLDKLGDGSSVSLTLSGQIYKTDSIRTFNLIAVLPGTDPRLRGDYLCLGAHLDHMGISERGTCYGADDDASGVSVVLEVARILSEKPCRHPILFALFSSEETGLLGSQYLASHHDRNGEKILAMINLDMLGRSDGNADGLAPIVIAGREQWKKLLDRTEGPVKFDWEYSDNYTRRSSGDHFPFQEVGIPSILLFSGYHADYHLPADHPDRIDFNFLQENTVGVVRLIRELDRQKGSAADAFFAK